MGANIYISKKLKNLQICDFFIDRIKLFIFYFWGGFTISCDQCIEEFSTTGCSMAVMVLMGQMSIDFLPIPMGCETCDKNEMIKSCECKKFFIP